MKKVICCFLIVVILSGCSKKVNLEEKKQINYNLPKVEVKCDEIKDIVDFSYYNNLFITKQGKLYQINFAKLFSNDKNCLEIESTVLFKKIIRGGIISQDNDIYRYDNTNRTLDKFNFEDGYLIMPYIQNINKNLYSSIISAPNDEVGQNYFYVDKEENKIYIYKEINYPNEYDDKPILSLDSDEKIEYVVDNLIKTNKAVYTFKKVNINKDECEKYADIECIYENKFIKEKFSKEEFSNIKFIYELKDFKMIINKNNDIYVSLNDFN